VEDKVEERGFYGFGERVKDNNEEAFHELPYKVAAKVSVEGGQRVIRPIIYVENSAGIEDDDSGVDSHGRETLPIIMFDDHESKEADDHDSGHDHHGSNGRKFWLRDEGFEDPPGFHPVLAHFTVSMTDHRLFSPLETGLHAALHRTVLSAHNQYIDEEVKMENGITTLPEGTPVTYDTEYGRMATELASPLTVPIGKNGHLPLSERALLRTLQSMSLNEIFNGEGNETLRKCADLYTQDQLVAMVMGLVQADRIPHVSGPFSRGPASRPLG